MVALLRRSRSKRVKGRCEKPAPDRKKPAGGLASVNPQPLKSGRGEQSKSRPEILFAQLSAGHAGGERG